MPTKDSKVHIVNAQPSAVLTATLDVQLYSAGAQPVSSFDPASSIDFIALIDPALVPFHRIAGSCLEVYSGSAETGTWLLEQLTNYGIDLGTTEDASGGLLSSWQSQIGVLCQVKDGRKSKGDGNRISEVLLYAARPGHPRCDRTAPLTPPRSSSPHIGDDTGTQTIETTPGLKVLALPLTSDNAQYVGSLPSPPVSPKDTLLEDGDGVFLPGPVASASESRKRERLDSLFEDATRQIKKARRQGGATVAKQMAVSEKTSRPGSADALINQPTSQPEMQVRKRPKPQAPPSLARSQSISSLQDLVERRPASRGDAMTRIKRGALSRVASTGQLNSLSLGSAVSTIEHQNRSAVSRTIMAGMRLYGLSNKRPSRSRAASELPTPGAESQPILNGEEDDFKMIYHHTYKAAVFALRKRITLSVLSSSWIRDVVDRLLAMFCTDHMEHVEGTAETHEDSCGIEKFRFDPPSQEASDDTSSKETGIIGTEKWHS